MWSSHIENQFLLLFSSYLPRSSRNENLIFQTKLVHSYINEKRLLLLKLRTMNLHNETTLLPTATTCSLSLQYQTKSFWLTKRFYIFEIRHSYKYDRLIWVWVCINKFYISKIKSNVLYINKCKNITWKSILIIIFSIRGNY